MLLEYSATGFALNPSAFLWVHRLDFIDIWFGGRGVFSDTTLDHSLRPINGSTGIGTGHIDIWGSRGDPLT